MSWVVCLSVCPSALLMGQIWELFDDVLILGAEGRQVYFGPVEEVPGWFGSMGYNVPPNTSVSDYVLDLLNNSFV